jgi:hypothetical protein
LHRYAKTFLPFYRLEAQNSKQSAHAEPELHPASAALTAHTFGNVRGITATATLESTPNEVQSYTMPLFNRALDIGFLSPRHGVQMYDAESKLKLKPNLNLGKRCMASVVLSDCQQSAHFHHMRSLPICLDTPMRDADIAMATTPTFGP